MTMQTRITLIGSLALALMGQASMAQPVYKIVGPDGKVTFSDKPPPSADKGKVAASGAASGGSTTETTGSNLPYELRQVASKYPVTLYASAQCAPCDSARSLLKSRGVPFAERAVSTTEDLDALQRLAGDGTLPFGTIGGQRLRGFSAAEWSQYLDAAGYPKTSLLPSNYKFATATPLVAMQKPVTPPKELPKAADPVDAPAAPSAPAPSNPAGITF